MGSPTVHQIIHCRKAIHCIPKLQIDNFQDYAWSLCTTTSGDVTAIFKTFKVPASFSPQCWSHIFPSTFSALLNFGTISSPENPTHHQSSGNYQFQICLIMVLSNCFSLYIHFLFWFNTKTWRGRKRQFSSVWNLCHCSLWFWHTKHLGRITCNISHGGIDNLKIILDIGWLRLLNTIFFLPASSSFDDWK